jgi:hypothetical protein
MEKRGEGLNREETGKTEEGFNFKGVEKSDGGEN